MLKRLVTLGPTFIISTSYRPYLKALSNVTGFPMEQIYCTDVNLDEHKADPYEVERLKAIASEITAMPLLFWTEKKAGGGERLTDEAKQVLDKLNVIFWEEIPAMEIGKAYARVNPVGGAEKARAVLDSMKKTELAFDHIVYAGDSITDVQAMKLVKQGGGVAISFNGNSYALEEANFALLGESPFAIAAIAKLITLKGKEGLSRPLERKNPIGGEGFIAWLKEHGVKDDYIEPLLAHHKTIQLFKIDGTPEQNLIQRSQRMRKIVRGLRVGGLG